MDHMNEVDEKIKIDPAAIGIGLMALASLATIAGFIGIAIGKWIHHFFK